MKTKLACFALGTLVLTVAVYLLWNVDDPIVADAADSAPAVVPPNVDNELNNQETAAVESPAVDPDNQFTIPDMTTYDDETLLQMVDYDADAAFELGFRRYGNPVILRPTFGNSEAREFFLRAIALEHAYADVAIPIMMEFDRLPLSEREAPSWGANRRLVAALLGERLGVKIDMHAEFDAYREIVPSESIHEEFRKQADTLLWRIAIHRANVTGDRALLDQIEEDRT